MKTLEFTELEPGRTGVDMHKDLVMVVDGSYYFEMNLVRVSQYCAETLCKLVEPHPMNKMLYCIEVMEERATFAYTWDTVGYIVTFSA